MKTCEAKKIDKAEVIVDVCHKLRRLAGGPVSSGECAACQCCGLGVAAVLLIAAMKEGLR